MNIQPITLSGTNYLKKAVSSQKNENPTVTNNDMNLRTNGYNVLFKANVPIKLENQLAKNIIEKVALYSKRINHFTEPVKMKNPVIIKDENNTVKILISKLSKNSNTNANIQLFKNNSEKESASLSMSLSGTGRLLEGCLKDSSCTYMFSAQKCNLEQVIDFLLPNGNKERYALRNNKWQLIRINEEHCYNHKQLELNKNPLSEIFLGAAQKSVSIFK